MCRLVGMWSDADLSRTVRKIISLHGSLLESTIAQGIPNSVLMVSFSRWGLDCDFGNDECLENVFVSE